MLTLSELLDAAGLNLDEPVPVRETVHAATAPRPHAGLLARRVVVRGADAC
jgi:hypothetical protein